MWLKAWHLIAMVTWFAGLFYLPRLFVYHAMSDDRISIDRFKIMERKLYYGRWTYKYESAARQGAVAAILIQPALFFRTPANRTTQKAHNPPGPSHDLIIQSPAKQE